MLLLKTAGDSESRDALLRVKLFRIRRRHRDEKRIAVDASTLFVVLFAAATLVMSCLLKEKAWGKESQEKGFLSFASLYHFVIGALSAWAHFSYPTLAVWHTAWELWENTPQGIEFSESFIAASQSILNRKSSKPSTIAPYCGDSVANSYGDLLSASLGWIAVHWIDRHSKHRPSARIQVALRRGRNLDIMSRKKHGATWWKPRHGRAFLHDTARQQQFAGMLSVIGISYVALSVGVRPILRRFHVKRGAEAAKRGHTWLPSFLDADAGFRVCRAVPETV